MSPAYSPLDTVEHNENGLRYRVVAVDVDSYFIRAVDRIEGDPHVNSAWDIAGMDEHTRLAKPPYSYGSYVVIKDEEHGEYLATVVITEALPGRRWAIHTRSAYPLNYTEYPSRTVECDDDGVGDEIVPRKGNAR